MRGSPCSLVAEAKAEDLIGHPASSCEGRVARNRGADRTEYMVDGTRTGTIEGD